MCGGGKDTAVATVTVVGINDAPEALTPPPLSTDEDTPVSGVLDRPQQNIRLGLGRDAQARIDQIEMSDGDMLDKSGDVNIISFQSDINQN